MYKTIIFFGLLCVTVLLGLVALVIRGESTQRPSYTKLSAIEKLFPRSKHEVVDQFEAAKARLSKDVEALITQDPTCMTFKSTFGALDEAIERFSIPFAAIYAVSIVSPDKETREAALQIVPQFTPVMVDLVSLHEKVYDVLKSYTPEKELSDEEQYFIEETLRDFKRSGLDLSQEDQARLKEIQQELAQLAAEFSKNINASDEKIQVDTAGLKGLEESFIRSLKKTDEGKYIIPTDYAHYAKVMQESEVADTRERLFRAYYHRGYPENESILKRYFALSDEMAKLLGYKSYAAYAIEDSMAKTPEEVEAFLSDLQKRALPKAKREIAVLKETLPEGVELKDNKLHLWDVSYVYSQYRKNCYNVDGLKVSEYFPLTYTIPALMKVYEDFFGLCIKKLANTTFWHEEIEAYAVYKDGVYRGLILLDLYPRPFKYSHGGHLSIVPAVTDASGKILPSVALVMVNFPRATSERPSLLKRGEVNTFFHEFGHALHAVLGATHMSSLSGTSVKKDFVEMPSQMFEEWLKDPAILKRISSHYLTKEPLPDEIIKNLQEAEQFGKADFALHQAFLSDLALAYYQPGDHKDPFALMKELFLQWRKELHFDPGYHIYASFNHLTGYGPMYYGYLWSKVYALDLFSVIEPYGLTNREIGERYAEKILAKGGSKDPEELLEDFLGRKPSSKAYFNHMGIE